MARGEKRAGLGDQARGIGQLHRFGKEGETKTRAEMFRSEEGVGQGGEGWGVLSGGGEKTLIDRLKSDGEKRGGCPSSDSKAERG